MQLSFIQKHKPTIIAITIGAIVGYAYYYFIGCANGQCIISSNPYVSVPYGALLGYLTLGVFKK